MSDQRKEYCVMTLDQVDSVCAYVEVTWHPTHAEALLAAHGRADEDTQVEITKPSRLRLVK